MRLKLFVIVGLALGLTLFLLAALIFGLGYWWRGRPEYSLNQIGVAVRTHNVHLFRRHVDIKSVSGRLIDDIVSGPSSTKGSTAEQSGQIFGRGLIGLLKPQIIDALEAQIERYVETGNFNSESSQDAIPTADLQDISSRLGPFDWATIDGNIATTNIRVIPDEKDHKPIMVGLKLRRTEDGFWQLMELSLPKDVLERVRKPRPE